MLYSSGTTGRPKGIKKEFAGKAIDEPNAFLRSCAPTCAACRPTVSTCRRRRSSRGPLRFNMMAITLGGTSIIMEHFDAREFLKLVREIQGTQSQLVPTMFVRMLKLRRGACGLRRLDAEGAIHAAAPCPVDVKAKMIEWWGPDPDSSTTPDPKATASPSRPLQQMADPSRQPSPRRGRQVKILDENDEERAD